MRQQCPSMMCTVALGLPILNFLKWKDDEGYEQVFRLNHKVNASWKEFGLLLGLSFNHLNGLETQFRGNPSECWNAVMDQWLNGGGSRDYRATWAGLYSLMTDAGFSKVARDLEKAVANSTC